MKYYNIKKNNDLILSEDKKFSPSEIKNYFLEALSLSKIDVIEFKEIKRSYYKIKIKPKSLCLNVVLKNITGAGWETKPKIKRIQVLNFMETDPNFVNDNSESTLNMIIGYYNFDDNPIFVGWEAYRYYNHKTSRSCYVTVDSLKRGYEKKFYEGIDSSQNIWIFKPEHFNDFLIKYIDYINIVGRK